MSNTLLVIITTALASLILALSEENFKINDGNVFCIIGKRSYSIFVWHQVLLALYRYSISSELTILFTIGFILAVIVISEISYRTIEQKLKDSRNTLITVAVLAFIICIISGVIYMKAGVVRDVPELGISQDSTHRNMHAEYCDRIYRYDKDFDENGKPNVLLIGSSFARDFGNIIIESGYDVNISYIYASNETYIPRIRQADIVFIFSAKDKVPNYIWENCDQIYGIGTKNFGSNNGNIYAHRFSEDYFSQSTQMEAGYNELDREWSAAWGDKYIEMIEPVLISADRVRVFTNDHMFISQDCRHLTQAGARYYADVLPLEQYLQ